MFVDFAGQTMEVFDGATGEVARRQVFVAVLGASSYTYAEAGGASSCRTGSAPTSNALAFFDGVPRQIVCDNLQFGDHARLLLRADGEPNLRRHGAALRHRSYPGTAVQSP